MPSEVYVKSPIVQAPVAQYVGGVVHPDSELESELRAKTLQLPNGGMISGSDVGALLGFLCRLIRADRVIEVGTFTGYTALKIAQALGPSGKLICCDVSEEWTDIARTYWERAQVHDRIDLRLRPAEETLRKLVDEETGGQFDMIFIDADKGGYETYYELGLQLLRDQGLMVFDNMLWDGLVADPQTSDKVAQTLRQLNDKISQDQRVEHSLLTVGDGLMLVQKRGWS